MEGIKLIHWSMCCVSLVYSILTCFSFLEAAFH